jgi:predicted transcriptional regulator
MQQLTNAEEQVMEHLWKLESLHERLAWSPKPKPATTTIATLLKEWSTSNLYFEFGNSGILFRQKTDYFSKHVNGLISNFFNNSASSPSLFTTETNLSQTELEDLKKIIDSEILKRKMSDFLIKSTITLSCYWRVLFVLEKKKYTFSIGFTCCSVLFFRWYFHS